MWAWATSPIPLQTLSWGVCAVPARPPQLCLTRCDFTDCGPPGSSVHGILQARILEWVAMPPPGDLPEPGIEPVSPASPALQADSSAEPSGKPYGTDIPWEQVSLLLSVVPMGYHITSSTYVTHFTLDCRLLLRVMPLMEVIMTCKCVGMAETGRIMIFETASLR